MPALEWLIFLIKRKKIKAGYAFRLFDLYTFIISVVRKFDIYPVKKLAY
jgi:hypothetical protein